MQRMDRNTAARIQVAIRQTAPAPWAVMHCAVLLRSITVPPTREDRATTEGPSHMYTQPVRPIFLCARAALTPTHPPVLPFFLYRPGRDTHPPPFCSKAETSRRNTAYPSLDKPR